LQSDEVALKQDKSVEIIEAFVVKIFQSSKLVKLAEQPFQLK
jgi:hypothetical protein